MRVLVTGSSGHVGGAVATHLAAAGHHVIGLGRTGGGGEGVADEVAADLGRPETWETLTGVLPDFDAVVHAAACLDQRLDAAEVAVVNCGGTQSVAATAVERGAALIHISGVPVIGAPVVLPIDEGHPTAPRTAYHASKLFAEHVTSLAGEAGIAAVSLRLSSPVGPGLPEGRILSVFARSAARGEALHVAGRGTRRQDYVDVRDVGTAVEAALDRRAEGVINVAAGTSVSNEELAHRCVELAGTRAAVVVGERPDPLDDVAWEVSIERASELLGWRPERTIDDAIRAAMA